MSIAGWLAMQQVMPNGLLNPNRNNGYSKPSTKSNIGKYVGFSSIGQSGFNSWAGPSGTPGPLGNTNQTEFNGFSGHTETTVLQEFNGFSGYSG